jgi:tetratricopeptide (TPR) repeat protein
MRVNVILGICLNLVVAGTACAALDGQIKPQEVTLLPEYCPYTITFTSQYGSREGTAQWMERLGPAFKSMHHYCWALIAMNRAKRVNATAMEKRHNYNSAVSDIDFVLRYAKEDFPLMPEILSRRGEALIKLKEFGRAETDLRKAIEIRVDYWPAYTRLAECFRAQGKRDAAIQTLKDGIPKVSDARMLQRLLAELEGSAQQSPK